MIATLAEGGPAERAGLRGFRVVRQQKRKGPFVYEETRIDRSYADMIVAVDGQRVKNADDLLSAIERKRPPEEEVLLTVVREGREVNVGVVLGGAASSRSDLRLDFLRLGFQHGDFFLQPLDLPRLIRLALAPASCCRSFCSRWWRWSSFFLVFLVHGRAGLRELPTRPSADRIPNVEQLVQAG